MHISLLKPSHIKRPPAQRGRRRAGEENSCCAGSKCQGGAPWRGGGGGGRATGERAPASQLRVNHSFHFSVRSRKGRGGGVRGGWEGAVQLAWRGGWSGGGHGEKKADYEPPTSRGTEPSHVRLCTFMRQRLRLCVCQGRSPSRACGCAQGIMEACARVSVCPHAPGRWLRWVPSCAARMMNEPPGYPRAAGAPEKYEARRSLCHPQSPAPSPPSCPPPSSPPDVPLPGLSGSRDL